VTIGRRRPASTQKIEMFFDSAMQTLRCMP
jgi:hypothetical protein